ncbi:RluA family pseudouridine synthase [Allorhodopirellula solitaria]|uniref:Ribosomal large subunit pseudouridine synthase A n=1 Tax=Allorhodopirellula solitaria TaxID=2527987 RepID=A0A5C5XRL7_9BACT|nr:RluA family pseudouridine synthase [Allorhodopirellula solitaria]TWT65298.1 Ribosomal large subunit pseudouridine synthase A [Allorhodopirellula solitaria]
MKTIRFDPLPGCLPYLNERLMRVRQAQSGLPLIDFLCEFHPPTPRENWRRWIACGEITIGDQEVGEDRRVAAGERYRHVIPRYVEPAVSATIGILHADRALLVVDKPAPLPVHPSGRFYRNTLSMLLATAYPDDSLRIAHRLDANTTGVVIFTRTAAAASIVQPQFESRQVEKQYLTRVQGHVPWDEYRCDLEIGDAKSLGHRNTAGARIVNEGSQPADTLFRRLDRFQDGTSLLQATPITGRTNQIRVHAAAMGFPVVGDPFYATTVVDKSDRNRRPTQTLGVGDPVMCLHAWRIGLIHPDNAASEGTPQRCVYESPPPGWAQSNQSQ